MKLEKLLRKAETKDKIINIAVNSYDSGFLGDKFNVDVIVKVGHHKHTLMHERTIKGHLLSNAERVNNLCLTGANKAINAYQDLLIKGYTKLYESAMINGLPANDYITKVEALK